MLTPCPLPSSLLLHCCCAPCASAILEWLLARGCKPTLFYYNPNIYPEAEYLVRKEELTRHAHSLGLTVIDGDYDHALWQCLTAPHAEAPERGARCLVCFKDRLLMAAKTAVANGIPAFATTLASSRWKSLDQIGEAGHWAAEQVQQKAQFLPYNWRKGGLQQRRAQLLADYGFYNQRYCGCEYSLDAMSLKAMQYLEETDSTNTYLFNLLSSEKPLPDGTAVYTFRQHAGRGQRDNVWESADDSNVSLSVLVHPDFLLPAQGFVLSMLFSLAVVEAVEGVTCGKADLPPLAIKWPNDIYMGDKKLGGILIENRLQGARFTDCVLGIGLNVRQREWLGGAPNPVSLVNLGVEVSPEAMTRRIVCQFGRRYAALRAGCTAYGFDYTARLIQHDYLQRLYRRSGFHLYYDPQRQERFSAEIVTVDLSGPLTLRLAPSSEMRSYWFKEIQYVLPSGLLHE